MNPRTEPSTFVGRTAELQRRPAAFATAATGEGALTFVVGEPGLGKTTLCGQLIVHATDQGGLALIGRCDEDGSLSFCYLPFVDALRSYMDDQERLTVQRAFSPAAPEIARIVPAVRDVLGVEAGPATNSETDRP